MNHDRALPTSTPIIESSLHKQCPATYQRRVSKIIISVGVANLGNPAYTMRVVFFHPLLRHIKALTSVNYGMRDSLISLNTTLSVRVRSLEFNPVRHL
jgi:hypothetical protein